MPDPEKIREALAKLTPEERARLEAGLLRWYAETGTLRRHVATRHGRAFEVTSEVVSVPAPPDYAGPLVVRLRSEDDEGGR